MQSAEHASTFSQTLAELEHLLRNLPDNLPSPPNEESVYGFVDYSPDPEWIKKTGTISGAFLRDLEVKFSNPNRRDSVIKVTDTERILKIRERGAPLESIIDAFNKFYSTSDVEIYRKWVLDLSASARHVYHLGGKPIPPFNASVEDTDTEPEIQVIQHPSALLGKHTRSDSQISIAAPAQKKAKKSAGKKKSTVDISGRTVVTYSWAPSDLKDDEDCLGKNESNGGRPSNSFVDSIVVPCHTISTGERCVRCAMNGCGQSWSFPRIAPRLYKHLVNECRHVPEDIRITAMEKLSGEALSKKLEKIEEGSLEKTAKQVGKEQKRLRVNQRVLNLICAAGVAPRLVDYCEWDALIRELDPAASTYSSSSFAQVYIPAEAVKVTEEAIKKLQKIKNLTISYDGGTTRATQSIYTVHVTTPNTRTPYFIEGSEGSGVSHTGEHIKDVLMKVIQRIGPSNFAGIASDSTGNTKLARELVVAEISTIIILPDICHLMNNMAKDIGKLPFFKEGTLASRGHQ